MLESDALIINSLTYLQDPGKLAAAVAVPSAGTVSGVSRPGAAAAVAAGSGGAAAYKLPKPSWRCDFCGYETTEARNLRIHMTSEKHAHNLLALQQSAAAAVSIHHQVYGTSEVY